MKSAEERFIATGMSYKTAMSSNAFTSGSWGWDVSGSQKNMRKSIAPSAICAPICWSPPKGPLLKAFTGRPVCSVISRAVVPVPHRKCPPSVPLLRDQCDMLLYAYRMHKCPL